MHPIATATYLPSSGDSINAIGRSRRAWSSGLQACATHSHLSSVDGGDLSHCCATDHEAFHLDGRDGLSVEANVLRSCCPVCMQAVDAANKLTSPPIPPLIPKRSIRLASALRLAWLFAQTHVRACSTLCAQPAKILRRHSLLLLSHLPFFSFSGSGCGAEGWIIFLRLVTLVHASQGEWVR